MRSAMQVELSAVVVALRAGASGAVPMVLTPEGGTGRDLPAAAFDPGRDRTLQTALRRWVRQTAGLELGYVEQLYTFGDPMRSGAGAGAHTVSIGYLALMGPEAAEGPDWTPWSAFFPWEDRRRGEPEALSALIIALDAWAGAPGAPAHRRERVELCFGLGGCPWRDELALERYELIYEADLVPEAWRDRGAETPPDLPAFGRAAARDHRRIMATGIGRLRGKLKYRPVLFGLVGESFTLLELQRAAEAVSGVLLHKQNFRRTIERSGLIEATGTTTARHGGRPAAEYRYAAEATWDRRAAALRLGGARKGG